MSFVIKPVAGSGAGVALPIIAEWVLKGQRVRQLGRVKTSGILGLGLGAAGLGAALATHYTKKPAWLKDEDKAAIAAFGGSSLVTGLAILLIDHMKKVPAAPAAPPAAGIRGLEELSAQEERPPEELIITI
jgi:cellobiose-specific phosphotransferase system component IIC